ncbi:MarR family winged helix-turn-helix transcriptional regulator [Peptostreptococcus faecalis]|uniref:MarR family winged helix-turn-helix transcriptional regulator n=1 Tax=Peptostreptococcus faecalis TaxID=2045015 RepID=UPI000C7C3984|nr:MarR family transcriptional regulator [Peptostreptococcus faecalis]
MDNTDKNTLKEHSYEETKKIINDIIIELFKNILIIEEKSLKKRGIKNLSMTEIHAIEAIGVGGGKKMSQVAEELGISMGTLTATVTKLEKKGYTKRTRHVNDGRVVLASLTKRGELVFKIHKNFHDEMVDHLMIDLDLHEDMTLMNALKNINNFFLKEYGGSDED